MVLVTRLIDVAQKKMTRRQYSLNNPMTNVRPLMKKVTLADRDEEGGAEEARKEKLGSTLALGEEVAAALETAAKGLEACLDDLEKAPRQEAELIRGTTEVVKATNKLVVCLKERQASAATK